jgi:nitroimidazol reductase NimA-like FMN-containing flavoprotein (pyridoxamine 5'-phosphate oxidase superfamily)
MEQNELLAYLRSQRLGVLGTLSPPGEPQAALVGYAVTPDFELLFDTLRTTRKYRNIIANPLVSFTGRQYRGPRRRTDRAVRRNSRGAVGLAAGTSSTRLLRNMAGWR